MRTYRMVIPVSDELRVKYSEHAKARGMALGSWVLNACAEQYDREKTTGVIKLRKRDCLLDCSEMLGMEGHSTRDLSGQIGTVGYLLEVHYDFAGRGPDHWRLMDEPLRTNMSGEPKLRGWLGTTDDVAYYAHGRVVVIGQSRTHIHLGTLPDTEEEQ